MLERRSQEPQRPQTPREGKLSLQGFAPHQTFRLSGKMLITGDGVQVFHNEGWVNAEVSGHGNNPKQPSHLRTFKLVGNKLYYAETVPLDGTLRLRWPAT